MSSGIDLDDWSNNRAEDDVVMDCEWRIAPVWPGREAAAVELAVNPIIAQILYNRGIDNAETARSFLSPTLRGLSEPEEYEQLTAAAQMIAGAVRDGVRVVVYCDYDVDGICGAAILWHIVARAGADLQVYIPHRVDEGYGLNADAVNKLADEGTKLLITVDCGIRDHDVVELANGRGMEVIITDHHEPGDTLPCAAAVVHPSRRTSAISCKAGDQVNPCGATVAFKLAWALAKELSGGSRVDERFRELLVELTALAALATIADVVPLRDENRILAKFGLEQMCRSKLVGLRALIKSTSLTGKRVGSYHVGFVLGPRLNAAGRMGHAQEAFELLTTDDCKRAEVLAGLLARQNKRRQKLEDEITAEAVELAESQSQLTEDVPVLVLAKVGWHVGVIGIVASRLVERFVRPVIMIAINNGYGQGSARSVDGYDINEALDVCSQHLLGYGGHAMAAGLQIESDNVSSFVEMLQGHARRNLSNLSAKRVVQIDAEVEPDVLNGDFLQQLASLGPFGRGNPRPLLASGPAELIGEPKIVGANGRHLSFTVKWSGRTLRAIAFNQAQSRDQLMDWRRCRLAFEPIPDEFLAPGAIQLRVKTLKPVV